MPGNIIVINNSKDLTFYVGDSKMPDLIKWLNKKGYKYGPAGTKKAAARVSQNL